MKYISPTNLDEARELISVSGKGEIVPCYFCKGKGSNNIYIGWDMKCRACRGQGWVVEFPENNKCVDNEQ